MKVRGERRDRTRKVIVRRHKLSEQLGFVQQHPHVHHWTFKGYGNCGSHHCGVCKIEKSWKKQNRKRDRIKRKKIDHDD